MQSHPQLLAARANESAGIARARASRMSYLPTISISGGWSGYTQTILDENYLITQAEGEMVSARQSCESTNDLFARLANPHPARDCNRYVFTDADRQAILAVDGALRDPAIPRGRDRRPVHRLDRRRTPEVECQRAYEPTVSTQAHCRTAGRRN